MTTGRLANSRAAVFPRASLLKLIIGPVELLSSGCYSIIEKRNLNTQTEGQPHMAAN